MPRRAKEVWTVEEARAEARACIEEGNKIIADLRQTLSHYEKMKEYYESWEDRLNVLDNVINEMEEDSGITKEEVFTDPNDSISDIEEYDPLEGID